MAVMAGVRAGICMTAAPMSMRSVFAARKLSTVGASDPYASAAHTTSYPNVSAARTSVT
jgi:hypothetical protein